MGRLDTLDLSLRLGRKEYERELAAAAATMAPAAPAHRRADGHRRARAGPAVRVRGQRRGRQGRGHQAPRRAAGPAPLPRDVVRQADVRREAPSVPLALLPVRAGPRRDVGVRPQLVRPGARRAGRGLRHRRGVGSGLRGDRQLRAHQLARGRDHRQVLAADQRRGAAAPLRGPPERSAAALEDHRRGLAQPQEGRPVHDRRRGDVRAHGPPPRAVGHHLGRAEATRPGPGAGAAPSSGSSRAWSASARRCRRPTSCRPSPTESRRRAERSRRRRSVGAASRRAVDSCACAPRCCTSTDRRRTSSSRRSPTPSRGRTSSSSTSTPAASTSPTS